MSNDWPPNQWRETRPLGPPPVPPPPPSRWGPALAIGALVLVIAVVAGVVIWTLTGDDTEGNAAGVPTTSAPKVDLSNLDIGSYDVEPREFPGPPTVEQGRYIAAMNLAEGIAIPTETFPTLTHVYGIPTPTPAMLASMFSGNGTPVIQPALDKHGMITAMTVQGYAVDMEEFKRSPGTGFLALALSSFANDNKAAQAAREMDELDMAANSDNVGVPIPGYPDAHAHFRPGYTSIAATMARGNFVISIMYVDPGGISAERLGAEVRRVLDNQVPLMNDLVVVPEAVLTEQSIDPDHMLSRVLLKGDPQIGKELVLYGPQGSALCATSAALQQDLFGEAGVDGCAGGPWATVLRTRDEAGAKALAPKLYEATSTASEFDIDTPQGVPDAICSGDREDDEPSFACIVVYGRYLAYVFGDDENDVRQRGAAQYALLVNNA